MGNTEIGNTGIDTENGNIDTSGTGVDAGAGNIENNIGTGGDTGTGAIENNTSGTGNIKTVQSQILTVTTNYTYDNNGNLIDDGNQKYFYDYKNRLIKVTNQEGDNIAAFSYDTLNRRYKKETSVKSITYIFDGVNIDRELISDKITEIQKEKTYINGIGVDNLLAYEIEGNTYYFAKDHLGNIDGLTDSTGNSVIKYEYSSFGKVYVIHDDNSLTNLEDYTGEDYHNDRLFTSREYDTEIDLLYLRARYYSPELGRFISRDPIDIDDDINLYTYVGNNPLVYVDLGGMKAKIVIPDRTNEIVQIFNEAGDYWDNWNYKYIKSAINPILLHDFKSKTLKDYNLKLRGGDDDINAFKYNGQYWIKFNGKEVSLDILGNMLYGYNGQKAGLSYGILESTAFVYTYKKITGKTKLRENKGKNFYMHPIDSYTNTINNEIPDREIYKAGYELGRNSKPNKLTKEAISNYLNCGYINKKD